MTEYCREQIAALAGPGHEDAFFSLIHAPISILPELVEAYRSESDRQQRWEILRVICERRSPDSLQFLAEELFDSDGEIWKQALDGIVMLGGADPIKALEAAKARASLAVRGHDFLEWLNEATEQSRRASQ